MCFAWLAGEPDRTNGSPRPRPTSISMGSPSIAGLYRSATAPRAHSAGAAQEGSDEAKPRDRSSVAVNDVVRKVVQLAVRVPGFSPKRLERFFGADAEPFR
jgi:hypothetical protein